MQKGFHKQTQKASRKSKKMRGKSNKQRKKASRKSKKMFRNQT
jgi:hypothetical protein